MNLREYRAIVERIEKLSVVKDNERTVPTSNLPLIDQLEKRLIEDAVMRPTGLGHTNE